MKNFSILILSLLLVQVSCNKSKKEDHKNTDTVVVDTVAKKQELSLSPKWTSDTTLKTCESVLYDKDRNILYVSNIDGLPPEKKDNNGFISKVSLVDGKIENLKWITGLSAPKGMGILGGKLYVTDISSLVEIDIEKGKIVKKYEVPGAKFLNDITIANDSTVYFSDSYTGKIHSFKNGKVTLWKEGFNAANGLLAMGDKLYLASMDSTFKVIDMKTKKDSLISSTVGAGDGVVYTGTEGDFIVSSWSGEVFYISADGKTTKLLDTKNQNLNSADIEFIPSQNLLLVPTFMGNKVQAYELKK
jgi:hypothetical protein